MSSKRKGAKHGRNNVLPLSSEPGTLATRMRRLEALSKQVVSADRTIVRRLAKPALYTSSVGGGLFYAPDCSGVTTFPDWTVESQNYQSYRVMAMRLRFYPILSAATAPTGNVGCPLLATSSMWGGSAPLTQSEAFQAPDATYHDGRRPFVHEADWSLCPNAKLWTKVGNTIPTEGRLGVCFASPDSTIYTLPVSTPMYLVVFEIFVEFGFFQ